VLVLYAVVLGLGYGGFIALAPAVVADRFGLQGLGGILGTLYTSAAVGSLAGPPLAGLLFDHLGDATAIAAASAISLAGWSVLLIPDRD
jgi:MFS family permease